MKQQINSNSDFGRNTIYAITIEDRKSIKKLKILINFVIKIINKLLNKRN